MGNRSREYVDAVWLVNNSRLEVGVAGAPLVIIGLALLMTHRRVEAILRRRGPLLWMPIWWTSIVGPLTALALGVYAAVLAVSNS